MTEIEKLLIGIDEVVPEKEFEEKVRSQKTLRVKLGVDPTGADLHIGHMVPFRKMREFQDQGHTGVVIIGDYTACIGDPTGRDKTRPPLSREQVRDNAATYLDQIYKVLDPDRTEVRHQSEWFDSMKFADVIRLVSSVTLAQIMAHETFRTRYENGQGLCFHEMMYPVFQAYDSLMINADIELGGTDQKFNILLGRDLQKQNGTASQAAILLPLLPGVDGQKMGKSLDNYIGVNEAPGDMFGKIMSIRDELIETYAALCVAFDVYEEIARDVADGKNPRDIKERLGREIVRIYHGEDAAEEAAAAFRQVFSNRELPEDIPEVLLTEKDLPLLDLVMACDHAPSRKEARRLIQQGGVRIDGEKQKDFGERILLRNGLVVKTGKRRFAKIVTAE